MMVYAISHIQYITIYTMSQGTRSSARIASSSTEVSGRAVGGRGAGGRGAGRGDDLAIGGRGPSRDDLPAPAEKEKIASDQMQAYFRTEIRYTYIFISELVLGKMLEYHNGPPKIFKLKESQKKKRVRGGDSDDDEEALDEDEGADDDFTITYKDTVSTNMVYFCLVCYRLCEGSTPWTCFVLPRGERKDAVGLTAHFKNHDHLREDGGTIFNLLADNINKRILTFSNTELKIVWNGTKLLYEKDESCSQHSNLLASLGEHAHKDIRYDTLLQVQKGIPMIIIMGIPLAIIYY